MKNIIITLVLVLSFNSVTSQEKLEKRRTLKEIVFSKKGNITNKELVFNFKNSEEDLIRTIDIPIGRYIISQRLKKSIEKKKFSGMSFEPLENYNNMIKVIY